MTGNEERLMSVMERTTRFRQRLNERGIVRSEFNLPAETIDQLEALRQREGLSSRSEALLAALQTVDLEKVKPEAA